MRVINEYILDDLFYNECFYTPDSREAVILCKKEDKNEYYLVLLNDGEKRVITLPKSKIYIGKGDQKGEYFNSVFLSLEKGFGLVVDEKTLYYYKDLNHEPECIEIGNSEIIDSDIRTRMKVCISNSNEILIPARQVQRPDSQYILLLDVDLEKRYASWKKIIRFKNEEFVSNALSRELSLINDAIVKNNKKFAYVLGEGMGINSIQRYGLRYYDLIEFDDCNNILSLKISSGDLREKYKDEKRRGVLGKFTSSLKYIILSPISKNDEWKGKQKLFDIENDKILDIKLPRGYSKHLVIDYKNDTFWLCSYKEGKVQFVQCSEK